ncbi:MAG: hypothetical protein OXG89_06735 [bacterium]|nr:hypothetical protein [bacterium]MYD04384.1 hypothetical protein [Acidimicrobiia bacterium]
MEPIKPFVHISGPKEPGTGERRSLLDRADQVFKAAKIARSEVIRIDVPGRGESMGGEGNLRPEVAPIVPAIQSGSLFGGGTGVLVMDAHQLLAEEARALAELFAQPGGDSQKVVLVTGGALPSPLAAFVKKNAEVIRVSKLRDNDAMQWITSAARSRGLRLDTNARQALVRRFGSDLDAIDNALDQLTGVDGPITDRLILERFRNSPDQPIWKLTRAIENGSVDDALHLLKDLLTHSHPLLLVAGIENHLRKCALAAAASDIGTFAKWIGSKPDAYPTSMAWKIGRTLSTENLSKAIDGVRRADAILKSRPPETHLLTLERLTISLCYWYRN